MSGVLLPWLEDEEHWRFRGWSKTEFWTVYDEPTYHQSNTRYYPENDTLWSVYQWEEVSTSEMVYESEIASGTYMYVNRSETANLALTGVPADGKMQSATPDVYDANQHYEIELVGADTAYITHVPTGTPIGYDGTQMAAKALPWRIYHEGDQTLFWTTIKGKNYVLWLKICDGFGENCHAGLKQSDPGPSPMGLMTTMMPTEIYAFTCHPEAMVGIDELESEVGNERVIQFGIYELHIRNGKKYIILK